MFKRIAVVGLVAVLGLVPAAVRAEEATPSAAQHGPTAKELLTDAAIIAILITASRAAYVASAHGSCGCPDDVDSAGHRCGGRSAHDKAGGSVVQCSPTDITPEMISTYRALLARLK